MNESQKQAFLSMVAKAALCCRPTIDNTWDLVSDVLVRGVEGDLVECGVFAGSHPAVMAKVCEVRGERGRLVHLFDSFCGIPMAGPEDLEIRRCIGVPPEGKEGALVSTGTSSSSVENVRQFMRRWGIDQSLLKFHVGWFQDTVPRDAGGIPAIAVLRLDGDLYESTKVCLEHLYPKLSPGGYCVIDDYALDGCRKAVSEYLAKVGESPEIRVIKGGQGPVYWQRG